MSKQRKKHPEIVERRKLARQIDIEADKKGYVFYNKRARHISKLKGGRKAYEGVPIEFTEEALKSILQ